MRQLLLLLLVSGMAWAQEIVPQSPSTASKEIVVVNVTNGLNKSNAKEAFEIIEELDPNQTAALILQIHCLMDTNWDEINLIMGGLGQLEGIPTYAFVDSMAVDAGALLAFSTDTIYMAPASIIGGSPILGDGNMKAKMESFNLATARAVAMSKGRDPKLVEAIWNEDLEVTWGEKIISKKGDTLMVEAQDAVSEQEGKRFIAEGLARDVYALKEMAGLEGTLRFTNADDPRAYLKDSPLDSVKMRETSFQDRVVVIEIGKNDLVNSARFDYMRRVLERAEHEKAQAVILDLNTPGGLAWHTGELMMRTLGKMETPTYAYVNPSAVSAGALIALATDKIYMSPVSAIGAAAVVTPFGDLSDDVSRKINAILVPLCRSVARANGHDPLYATKFMIPEKAEGEEKSGDSLEETDLVVEEQDDGTYRLKKKKEGDVGDLLSLAATEAVDPWREAAPLAAGIAKSLEELMEKESLDGEVVLAEPLGFELLAQWVTRFSAIILLVAFLAAQAELRMPGFGVFGFLSLGLFALFFFGHYAAGKLIGFEMVALFVLGIVLIIVEFVFFPGTLVSGLLGFVCILVALIYTMADGVVLPSGELSPWKLDGNSVGDALWNLTVALGGAVIIGILTARFFPESPLFKRLVLQSASAPAGPSLPDLAPQTESTSIERAESSLIGRRGEALTPLRPAGTAMFGNDVLDVVSDGEYLAKGAAVEVTTVEGSRVVVKPRPGANS